MSLSVCFSNASILSLSLFTFPVCEEIKNERSFVCPGLFSLLFREESFLVKGYLKETYVKVEEINLCLFTGKCLFLDYVFMILAQRGVYSFFLGLRNKL